MWACSTASCTAVLHFCNARPPQPPQHEVIWRGSFIMKKSSLPRAKGLWSAGIRSGHGQRFRARVRPVAGKSPPGGAVWPVHRSLF